jgi:O-antigen ligase
LLGPFAALAAIYATVKTLDRRSYKYAFLAGLSFLTCLVSGSRSAALGAVAGVAIIPIFRIKSRALRWICIIFLLGTAFFVRSTFDFNSLDGSPLFAGGDSFEKYVAELQIKGMTNTREQLWKDRWVEFDSSPIVGIGVGVEEAGGTKTEYGTIVVEPGSSYLAILSMTGIVGALSFGILVLTLVVRVQKKWTLLNSTDRTEIVAVGMFWAVHAVAEGWIFAGGSILCLFFWIWVGRLSNLGSLQFKSSPAI